MQLLIADDVRYRAACDFNCNVVKCVMLMAAMLQQPF